MKTAPFGFLRVAAASPAIRVADPEYNLGQILEQVADAHTRGVQVMVFPELALSGYTCGDLFFSMGTLIKRTEAALAHLLEATADLRMLIAVGLPARLDS